MNRFLVTGVAAVAALVAAVPSVEARMGKSEAAAAVEKAYPVKVLRIRSIKMDGKVAYAVTVMNAGGDFNEAYQVTTLIVDPDTGRLMPVFRHRASGYELSDGGDREPNRQATDGARGKSVWR